MSKSFVNHDNTAHRPSGKYANVIQEIQKDGVCPFCSESLKKYHKKPILAEKKYWLLTENMYPYDGASHHLLIVHKDHIEDFSEISSPAWQELQELVKYAVKSKSIPGAALLLRFGNTAYTGASVSHLHAQLVSGNDDATAPPILTRVG
jgi:diadenosine tetraphosphate (Ap4A) HIT family hydrolase